jgi:hypothetical protein
VNPAHESDDVPWRKSTRSGAAGNCVEVAQRPDSTAVRDSKDPTGPVLSFANDAWGDFLAGVRRGVFDAPRV